LPELSDVLCRPAWMELGACRGMDPTTFIPSQRRPPRAAKAVCSECPVRTECLDYAMADETCVGVWGGTSTVERRAIREGVRVL
jgi:WhiB family redox-sensing transcriptional regulator